MTRFEKVLKDIGNILEENNVSHGEFSTIVAFLKYGYETQENKLIKNENIRFNLNDVLSNEWTKAHIHNQEKKETIVINTDSKYKSPVDVAKKIRKNFGEDVKVSGTKEKEEKFEVEITRTEDGEKVEYLYGNVDSLDDLITNIDKFVERMRPIE